MSEKYSSMEPAVRPYQVDLSVAEIAALINHHIRMTKKVTKIVGDRLLKLQAPSTLPSRMESNSLIKEGRKIVDAHTARAKGLQSIFNSNGGGK